MPFQTSSSQTNTNFFQQTITPAISFVDSAGQFELIVELPGVSSDDIDVLIEGGFIVVRGERKFPDNLNMGSHHLITNERAFGRFERVIQLPMFIEASKVQAQIINGILTIILPKKGTDAFPYKEVTVTNGSKSNKINVKQ